MPQILDLPRVLPAPASALRAVWTKVSSAVQRVVRTTFNELMVKETVDMLGALNDHSLRDIGLHRSEIESRVRRRLAATQYISMT